MVMKIPLLLRNVPQTNIDLKCYLQTEHKQTTAVLIFILYCYNYVHKKNEKLCQIMIKTDLVLLVEREEENVQQL